MGLDGNMEDTYTVANKVQDRYYYSSKFDSGIRDWSARMDFDYTPYRSTTSSSVQSTSTIRSVRE